MSKTISEQLADFALSFPEDGVPEEIAAYGRLLLLDTFGVAMSCQELPHAAAVKETLRLLGSSGPARLWGSRETVSPADAVLYNSCLIHGADYDDTHVAGVVHPSAAVVSTAVTIGQCVQASGREMMAAMVVGWEIMVRLALAAGGRFHDVGYHCTGIVAPFAAACVAARLLKLDRETLINALGICGSQAAALQEFLQDGTWAKKIHPGWGCHSAVYALLMAKGGFTGPRKVFEGKFGMWNTHLGSADGLQEQMEGLGTQWHISEIAFKMYPVCHMAHSFIDCMLALQREHGFRADDIEEAECRIETRCYHVICDPRDAKIHPQSDYMMRFSLPYLVAIAAVVGRVSPWEIDLRYAQDPNIVDLMARIQCVADDSKRNPGYFPGWLKVRTRSGECYQRQQLYELGTPQNPIKPDDVVEKFRNNVSAFYSDEATARLCAELNAFQEIPNAERLLDLLIPDKN